MNRARSVYFFLGFYFLSLFSSFFFYKTPSLLIFRGVKPSNFLTNAGIPGFSIRASLFPHDGSPSCLRWSSSRQQFATAYTSTILWGCRLSERALSIGITFAMYKVGLLCDLVNANPSKNLMRAIMEEASEESRRDATEFAADWWCKIDEMVENENVVR